MPIRQKSVLALFQEDLKVTCCWPFKILSFEKGLIQILINDRLEGWKKKTKQQQQQKS